MHITKRGNKLTAVINLKSENGKRRQKRLTQKTGETKQQFEDRCKDIEVRVHRDEYIDVTDMTLEAYLKKWMKHQTTKINPIAYKTAHNYQYMIDKYINKLFGHKLLCKLAPTDIEDLYRTLSDKPDTAIYCHRVLHAALKRAMKWRLIKYNPMDGVDAPTKQKEEELSVWEPDTMDKFASQAASHIIFLPALIASMSGLRRGEICGLTWDCIDYERECIIVNKQLQRYKGQPLQLTKVKTHRSNRPVKISPALCNILKEHHKRQQAEKKFMLDKYCDKIHSSEDGKIKKIDNNLVVRWQDGRPLDPDYISTEFPLLAAQYGLPRIRFHALRHSHAKALVKSGIEMFIISRRLGHAALSTTSEIYGHSDIEMQEQAANVIKITEKKPLHGANL